MSLVEGSLKLLQLEVAERSPVNQQQHTMNKHFLSTKGMLIVFSVETLVIMVLWTYLTAHFMTKDYLQRKRFNFGERYSFSFPDLYTHFQ